MKYDDASWHYGGKFPSNLPKEAAATHIGMFLTWMIVNGFGNKKITENSNESFYLLKNREITGADFLLKSLDEKLTNLDFNKEGNAFAVAYYEGKNHDSKFIDDYFSCFYVNENNMYEVENTWQNFDKISILIDQRFATWNEQRQPKYII